MTIEVTCPCGTRFVIPEGRVGKSVHCHMCGRELPPVGQHRAVSPPVSPPRTVESMPSPAITPGRPVEVRTTVPSSRLSEEPSPLHPVDIVDIRDVPRSPPRKEPGSVLQVLLIVAFVLLGVGFFAWLFDLYTQGRLIGAVVLGTLVTILRLFLPSTKNEE
jgi:hypothetical protein